MNNTVRRQFHTFDALRFFAFLKVFLLHLPIFAFPWFNFIKAGGGIGVHFFFVLSGFLITYIICEEKLRTGQLDLKNFFARRILRIWPLYYLMVGVAYLIPHLIGYFHFKSSANGYDPNICVSALFLENYRVMFTRSEPNSSLLAIMWSLCVEEQFYIIWGLLLYFIPLKRLPILICICIVIALVFRFIYTLNGIPTCDVFAHFDLFAFGAVPAYLIIAMPDKINRIVNNVKLSLKILFIILLITSVIIASQYAGNDWVFIWLTTILGGIFSVLIILLLPEKNDLKISDKNILSRLGAYTYGLYLYHISVLLLLVQIYLKLGWPLNRPLNAISFTIIALLLSILCSILSYHLFEKHFLKLKKYFR